MTTMNPQWRLLAAASVVAFLAGCNNGGTTVPTPAPIQENIDFSTFANQVFANSANSTPVEVNGITFNFDVNDDPTAFDSLIMAGVY